MSKDIIVGLTAIFIPWALIIALVATRLVIANWQCFVKWREQDRETQVKMSLWLATPILMGTWAIQHATALLNYLTAGDLLTVGIVLVLMYRPIMLFGVALVLWYVFNRIYYPNYAFIDRLWTTVVITGIVLGVITTALSYYF